MKWMKRHAATFFNILAAVVGLSLVLYPSVSDWWNGFHQSRMIMSYADSVADMSAEESAECLKNAEDYNRALAGSGVLWKMDDAQKADYDRQLNIQGEGVMGYISIPKINVSLPIYHGVDESVLQVAIGHLPGTSLPVGGKGTHTVVSGHRGLPSARLFTDLDQLSEGDTWTITVLDQTITYECDQIRTVEPTDLSELAIDPDQDYCTLVTCTPYGINTQRLLVRGHRVANALGDKNITSEAVKIDSIYVVPFVVGPILVLFFILTLVRIDRGRKRKRGWKEIRTEFNAEEGEEKEK